ncbi:uncharacterized protein [Typha latifolia]|uniref:uncharacterized protein n=1 Tax=Typha latifolia TaxID=4733 RepID=UPI003C2CEF0B
MCNAKTRSGQTAVAQIDGRPVLQPASNRLATLEDPKPLKKSLQKSLSLPAYFGNSTTTTDADLYVNEPSLIDIAKALSPISPTSPLVKDLNSCAEKPTAQKKIPKSIPEARKKSKKLNGGNQPMLSLNLSSFSSDRAPGSNAAAQREQATLMQVQRKMRIAHYGRTVSMIERMAVTVHSSTVTIQDLEDKRCSFITPYSDPLYVSYHDEEWGVPVHDDKMLFEQLVLSGAQVGSDWTTILKKRNDFRGAFAGFDAEVVAKFTEKRIVSIGMEYGLELGRVRGVVDNANRILELKQNFGSLDKYLWAFVNNKPITPKYKFSRKIPIKTSKSESISKDMVRRGFRFVGPTVIHSFMQAAGLTNDHLLSCPRHLHCLSLLSSTTH